MPSTPRPPQTRRPEVSAGEAASREAQYLETERKRSFRAVLLAAADHAEFRLGDDDLGRIRPGHLLCTRREVEVEPAHLVVPAACWKRQHRGRPERHRAERILIL